MLKDELKQFYGTEHYYSIPPSSMLATDGVKYFAEKAEAYWLITNIAINKQMNEKLKDHTFVVVKTKKKDDGGILVQYEDGNYNVLLIEEYPLSNLPDDGEYSIWVEYNVLLLPGEH